MIQATPIRRRLFSASREFEHRGSSPVISFKRPNRWGRYWLLASVLVVATLVLTLWAIGTHEVPDSRNPMASAKWSLSMSLAPARSAMVRATFSTR